MNLPLRPFWSRWQNVIRPITETPIFDGVVYDLTAQANDVACCRSGCRDCIGEAVWT